MAVKLYLKDAAPPAGAGDIFYVSRPDGSADGKVDYTAMAGVIGGLLQWTYAPLTHSHTADALSDASADGRALITAADAGAMRAVLGVEVGEDVQAWSANLDAYAAVAPSATGLALLNGATASDQLTTLGVSTFAKTMLDDANAAAVRATIGAGTGNGSGDLLAVNALSELAGVAATTRLNISAAGAGLIASSGLTTSTTSRIVARKTAGGGAIEECTLSEVLDFIGPASQGDVLYRGGSGWTRLGAGSVGQVLQTNGAGANPGWATISGGGTPGGNYESAPTKPIAVDFTLQNAGTASMTDGTFGLILTMPSSTANIRFMKYNAGLPGTSWNIVVRSSAITPYLTTNIHHAAILLRNSSNSRIINFASSGATTIAQRWSSYSAFSAGIFSHSTFGGQWLGWKKISCDGTTLSFYASSNGFDWGLLGTEPLATYIGSVDEVGIGSVNGAASSLTNYDLFESFTVF